MYYTAIYLSSIPLSGRIREMYVSTGSYAANAEESIIRRFSPLNIPDHDEMKNGCLIRAGYDQENIQG